MTDGKQTFTPDQLGIWEFTVSGRVDYFKTWRARSGTSEGAWRGPAGRIRRRLSHDRACYPTLGPPDITEELIRFKNALQKPDGL
jgi:hypothetical protein